MLSELVNRSYKQLNENDIIIWNYIRANKKKCEKMSIDTLASHCHVSRTTVLRFAKRIGLKGFAELKVYLRMESSYISGESTKFTTLESAYIEYMQYLEKRNFDNIIKEIIQAKNLYVYGHGVVQKNVAQEMKRLFLAARKIVFTMTSSGETDGYEEIIQRGDVLFVISISGETEELINFVKAMKLKGVHIIAITASKENSLIWLADDYITVMAPNRENQYGRQMSFTAGYFILLDYLVNRYIEHFERIHDEYTNNSRR